MKTRIRITLTAVLGALALAASTGALAHDRGRHDGHRGHGWGHVRHHYAHHHYHRHQVIRERVIVRQPPPVYYERRAYYAQPAIVIGVDLPPLVVPLR